MRAKHFCLAFLLYGFLYFVRASKSKGLAAGLGSVSPNTDKRLQINRDRDKASDSFSGRLFYLNVNDVTIVIDTTERNFTDTKTVARDAGATMIGCGGLEHLDGIARYVTTLTKLWPAFPKTYWIALGQRNENEDEDQFVLDTLRDGNYILYKKPSDSNAGVIGVLWI